MKLKFACHQQQSLRLKRFVSSSLALGILFNNILTPFNSFAGVLSDNARYEAFEGSNLVIDDILEDDKVNVEIEGNTLVNLIDYSKINTNFYNYNLGYISENNSDNRPWSDIEELSSLKPDTYYTVIVENLNTASAVHIGYNRDWRKKINDKVTVFRTPDVMEYGFVFKVHGAQSNVKIMLLEGDYRNKDVPDYFEGLKSVGELEDNILELVSRNKNLWDGTYEPGSIYTGEDDCYPGEDSNLGINRKRSYYIPVKPNTTYTISQKDFLNVEESEIYIHQYDKYKQNILWKEGLSYRGVKEKLTFTTDSNAYYLRFRTQNNRELTPDTVMLEEGNVATTIVQQYNNKKVVCLNEPLRGLPNGARDKIIKKNGQWYIERNCGIKILSGNNEQWSKRSDSFPSNTTQLFCLDIEGANAIKDNIRAIKCDRFIPRGGTGISQRDWECIFLATNGDGIGIYLRIDNSKLDTLTVNGLNKWLADNPTTVVYQLATPIYEPLEVESVLNIYTDLTYISNNSNIPATMRVTVDRTLNQAVEYTELAKVNPTIENLSKARYWNNLLKDSIKKDQLQEEVNSITELSDMQLERKTATTNLDLYIKSENMLSMSLNTNSITFEDFSGVEDMEKINAVNISINSSLPYSLNAYLPTEIQNTDKSVTMNKDILNIKENSEPVYQTFANTADKVVLKDNCSSGNDLVHGIDIKLKSGIAHKKDVYKTTVKFEAEQK